MNRVIMTVFVAVLAAAPAAAEFRVLNASGMVRVAAAGSDVFAPVAAGQILAQGSQVSTGENGRVTIEVGPKNLIKLRGNAKIVVGSTLADGSRIKLLAGRIKGVFAGLTGGRKFDVEFQSRSAVASVKGTVLDAEDGPDGIRIRTAFGAVDFFFNGTRHGVPQGCGLLLGKDDGIEVRALSNEEIDDSLSDGRGLRVSNERRILHDFVGDSQDAASQEQDVVTQIHEDDFAVGRSLRDVHGNLTRVDQRLTRPYPNVIQVTNLVKRNEYLYAGKFGYAGTSGPRFDYLETWVEFNRGLPGDVLDWPAFLEANSETIDLVEMRTTISNGRFNDPSADTLVMRDRPDGNDQTDDGRMYLNGVRLLDSELDGTDADGLESGELWATSIKRFYRDANNDGLADAGVQNIVDLRIEVYGINEEGTILSLAGLTDSALRDPIGVLRTSAAEIIVSGVDGTGANVFGGTGNRSNIDLVVIPDLILAIAAKYGPSLSDLDVGGE